MLTTKERNRATTASSRDSGVIDSIAFCGRVAGADQDLSADGQTPLAALKRVMDESFDHAQRAPIHGAQFLGGPRIGQAECEPDEISVFEMLARHVRAAQRAGELKAGDASLMTTLIIGAVVGAADLLQYGRPDRGNLDSDAEFPPLLLLDLLSTKRCN